jgi:serine/threonine-protein kinase
MMVTSNVRLVRPLGEGGMGSVWVADHLSLRTTVVVKFMAKGMAGNPEATARFSREAAAASQVKSPHVVQMLDHGVGDEGRPYIVMELLEGRDLDQRLRGSRRVDPTEVVAIVAQLARALSKAHERGIVHRDVKPSNVFLLDAGGGELFVKLLDFGIAKGPAVGIVGSTTRTGAFVGSPYYMSPEQVIGAKDMDFRSDLWSLGVVAYQALTGELPFHAETVGALALKIHRDPLPVPTSANAALPPAVDAWFAKACARDPHERFASAKEMADAFAKVFRLGNGAADPADDDSIGPTGATDVRAETADGMGLATSGRTARSSPGRRWWMVGIAIVAAAVGWALPARMTRETREPAPDMPPVAGATAAATTTATATATSTATSTSTSTPTATSTPTPTPTTTPTATATAVANPAIPHRRPRAGAAGSSSASSGQDRGSPRPGSDDDIK